MRKRDFAAFVAVDIVATVAIGALCIWILNCQRIAGELEYMTGRETSTWDIVCVKLHVKGLADLRREHAEAIP